MSLKNTLPGPDRVQPALTVLATRDSLSVPRQDVRLKVAFDEASRSPPGRGLCRRALMPAAPSCECEMPLSPYLPRFGLLPPDVLQQSVEDYWLKNHGRVSNDRGCWGKFVSMAQRARLCSSSSSSSSSRTLCCRPFVKERPLTALSGGSRLA
jgi:hypothetical protein